MPMLVNISKIHGLAHRQKRIWPVGGDVQVY